MKVLILLANSKDREHLKLDREMRLIRDRSRGSQEPLIIERVDGVQASDLVRSLREHKPDIVHFSGHGEEDGRLVFLNDAGFSQPIEILPLIRIVREFCHTIKCIVLNSCFAKTLASALAAEVPVVIGAVSELDDAAAVVFSGAFYQELSSGSSIGDAFSLAVAEVELTLPGQGELFTMSPNDGPGTQLSFYSRPQIIAEFVLSNNGKPAKDSDGAGYEFEISISDSPVGTQFCLYHYDANDLAIDEDTFDIVPDRTTNFAVTVDFEEDLEIRATLWLVDRGIALSTRLSTALQAKYGKNPPSQMTTAFARFVQQKKSKLLSHHE